MKFLGVYNSKLVTRGVKILKTVWILQYVCGNRKVHLNKVV